MPPIFSVPRPDRVLAKAEDRYDLMPWPGATVKLLPVI